MTSKPTFPRSHSAMMIASSSGTTTGRSPRLPFAFVAGRSIDQVFRNVWVWHMDLPRNELARRQPISYAASRGLQAYERTCNHHCRTLAATSACQSRFLEGGFYDKGLRRQLLVTDMVVSTSSLVTNFFFILQPSFSFMIITLFLPLWHLSISRPARRDHQRLCKSVFSGLISAKSHLR
jgi:hypothetical protein